MSFWCIRWGLTGVGESLIRLKYIMINSIYVYTVTFDTYIVLLSSWSRMFSIDLLALYILVIFVRLLYTNTKSSSCLPLAMSRLD